LLAGSGVTPWVSSTLPSSVESEPGRDWEPAGNRCGAQALGFEFSAFRSWKISQAGLETASKADRG
jgi:hypothetical protein